MLADSQHDLAESLNAFNDIYLSHEDQQEPAQALKDAVGAIARQATATAIFALGIAQRLHLAAHQN